MLIDPRITTDERVTGAFNTGDIPGLTKKQIDFGFVPNIDNLRTGDLILTQPATKPTIISNPSAVAIQAGQSLQYPNAKWTHAAIYVHDWQVIEANPGRNVSAGTILNWIPDKILLVRRPIYLNSLRPSRRLYIEVKIVLEAAMLQESARYGFGAAMTIPFRTLFNRPSIRRLFPKYNENDKSQIICSALYEKCYHIATAHSLLTDEMKRSGEPVTPELLSQISTLENVNVGWARLINSPSTGRSQGAPEAPAQGILGANTFPFLV